MAQAMVIRQQAKEKVENAYRKITVKQRCGAAGAEIGGVDLSKPLEQDTIAEIRRAFLENCVLAFRGQDVSPEKQIAFTGIFGKVEQHPLYRTNSIEGYPEILVLEHKAGQYINGKNDIWHADITFNEAPPLGSVLQCRAAWEGYADTMFANQYMAYEALSEPLRHMLDGLNAEHSAELLQRRNNAHSYNKPIKEIAPPVLHPVVRTHPETGRKSLFVNPTFTTRILGLSEEESRCPWISSLTTRSGRTSSTAITGAWGMSSYSTTGAFSIMRCPTIHMTCTDLCTAQRQPAIVRTEANASASGAHLREGAPRGASSLLTHRRSPRRSRRKRGRRALPELPGFRGELVGRVPRKRGGTARKRGLSPMSTTVPSSSATEAARPRTTCCTTSQPSFEPTSVDRHQGRRARQR